MIDDPKIIYSPLSRVIDESGCKLYVQIYRLENTDWSLEVVDAGGTSTVWHGTFKNDEEALKELYATIEEEGIGSLVN